MYSDEDLQAAVVSGALSTEAADALRAHAAVRQATPPGDEEQFRLITGFNDIFVTIAAGMILFAVAAIGRAFTPNLDGPPPFAGLLVAGAAWTMAGVVAVYVGLGLVALAVDRRALLVSALAYVLAALTWLFDRFGAVELNVALTARVIGSALLTLSALWTPIRQSVVGMLPDNVQMRLPATGRLTAAA